MKSISEKLKNVEEIIDAIDLLSYGRPIPYREYDQIYMKAFSMLMQLEDVSSRIANKRVVFLGDGDGLSILTGLLAKRFATPPKSITVLDFDERILNNVSNAKLNFLLEVPCETRLYNIIDPADEDLLAKHDFFLINPPYGSKNKGLSCILWLHRCLDLCTSTAGGCIIIPTCGKQEWISEGFKSIKSFLESHGFEIEESLRRHCYHLPDNPDLLSEALYVSRKIDIPSEYQGRSFSLDQVSHLYGDTKPIPHYIFFDQKNPLGRRDFEWPYGSMC